jgi:catecholate siderophore receptor
VGTKGEGKGRHLVGASSLGFAALAAANAQAQTAPETTPPDNDTVVVTGQRSSLDLVTAKILDTPQSINIVPAQIIRQQGVSNLQEALRNVPGITLNAGEGGTHGDLVNLRGFSAGDDYFLDGLRDTGLYDRDPFNTEAIEVYKGPASTLFGRGSTGGVINQVSKSPQLDNAASLSLTAGANNEFRGVADVNYVIGHDAALRISAMDMRAETEGRPFAETNRWGIAPSVAFGIGADASFTLRYLHQHEDNLPDYGIPFLFGRPAPVAHDAFYGLPADDHFGTDVDIVTARFEHKFSPAWAIADTARYGRYEFDSRQTAAIYGSANCYPTGMAPSDFPTPPICAGASGETPVSAFNPFYPILGTPLDDIFVERDRPSSAGVIETAMNATTLTGNFSALGVAQTLVAGVEIDRESADLVRFTNQNTMIAPTPLLNPDPHQAFPGHQTSVRQRPSTETETTGVLVSDTFHLAPQWDVIAAVRFDHFHAQFDQPLGTPSHFQHTDDVTSPRFAIVYKPDEAASIYLTYGTSFNPSAENLSLAANNQALPPEEDHTYELGGKIEIADRRLALTGALFDTEMTNARITDPLSPSLQALAGTITVHGVELGAQGRLTRHWEILAGYTYLDTEAIGLVAPGLHTPIPNTAQNQANLWTAYEAKDFQIGAGVNYTSERFANADLVSSPGHVLFARAPGYTTFDAMAAYNLNDHTRLQLNGYNLTDKFYYSNAYFSRPGENHTVPGAGRTLMLTLNVAY